MRTLINFLVLLSMLVVTACTPQATETAVPTAILPEEPEQVDLTVFAAASLTEVFTEIGEAFRLEHPEVTFVFNFAGSQQLAQQINEGAPADVFASANTAQMEVVVEAGNIQAEGVQPFVRNRLVVIYPGDNPGNLSALADLANPGLKLVFAAEEVPVGRYSVEFLDKASAEAGYPEDFKEAVLANVVSFEDNVKAVLTKVSLGEADAGIVYLSDISQAAHELVGRLEIPDALNVIATYPIAPVNDSANPEMAAAFIEYVLSTDGQVILAKFNFIPVKQGD